MSSPGKISFAEFAAKVAAEQEDGFVWSDLLRFDYDAPKERVALVSWCDERVDEHGEVFEGCWRVIMAGEGRRWSELHDWGVLYFGEPPWRRSQVLRVVGRLGSVEAAVKALAKPAPDFVYSFGMRRRRRRWLAQVAGVWRRRLLLRCCRGRAHRRMCRSARVGGARGGRFRASCSEESEA